MELSPHDERLRDAEDAIDEVASDLSVDRATVVDSLEQLIDHAQTSIDAIKEDAKREGTPL